MDGKTVKPGKEQQVLVWDEGRAVNTYANIAEITASRDAMTIKFGVEKARQAGQDEVGIQLSKQVILNPLDAKRLAIRLREVLDTTKVRQNRQQPESSVAASEQQATTPKRRDTLGEKKHLESILTLFRQLGNLETRIDFEPSFKAVHGGLFENRFLLGVNRGKAGTGLDEGIAAICEKIGMPLNLLASFKKKLPDANHVYFGVEKSGETLIIKGYLEYRDKIEKEISGVDVRGCSFTLFTGFKWDSCFPSRQAEARYAWYPSLTVPEICEQMERILGLNGHRVPLEVAQGIIRRASGRISPGDIQYLEVAEEGNPRKSFDINIYKSKHCLADMYPLLSKAMQHYALAAGKYLPLYERIKKERFGHLAGGIDRENRDFMTVYYGVKKIDSGQLRSATIVPRDHQQDR